MKFLQYSRELGFEEEPNYKLWIITFQNLLDLLIIPPATVDSKLFIDFIPTSKEEITIVVMKKKTLGSLAQLKSGPGSNNLSKN
jgi:hypothetical protein